MEKKSEANDKLPNLQRHKVAGFATVANYRGLVKQSDGKCNNFVMFLFFKYSGRYI